LTVANDEAFVEIAQQLAARVMRDMPGGDSVARLRYAMKLCLCRQPSPRELAALQAYYGRQVALLAQDSERVQEILPAELQMENAAGSADAAALVLASRAILNTDNFITRE
jgi:hypothetical protein